MDFIYFNHRGLEDSNEDNLQILLQEMSNKISICRDNNLTVGFYKEIYNIPLKNLSNTFINYICSKQEYRDFCTLMITYIDQNIIYPRNNIDNLYIEGNNFKQWFFEVCLQDNISSFISLSNDDLFESSSYIESEKTIFNFIKVDNLVDFIKSVKNNFTSFTEIFDKIQNEYQGKIEILPNAKNSTRQLPVNNKVFNNIYSALSSLVEIVLPTNSNTLTERICNEYYYATTFKISPESKKTARHYKYKRHRTYSINGIQYLFENHVKIGNNIRIHYYILDRKIYIGYCGCHLPTSDFN